MPHFTSEMTFFLQKACLMQCKACFLTDENFDVYKKTSFLSF